MTLFCDELAPCLISPCWYGYLQPDMRSRTVSEKLVMVVMSRRGGRSLQYRSPRMKAEGQQLACRACEQHRPDLVSGDRDTYTF
jgi:hypothetical protein